MIKPTIGRIVHFYDPKITQRIGWTEGFGRRGIGPYAAIVVNDLGDMGLELLVLFPGVGAHLVKDVPEKPAEVGEKPYWTWPLRWADTPDAAVALVDQGSPAKAALEDIAALAAEGEKAPDWSAGTEPEIAVRELTGLEKARAVAAANRQARKAAEAANT